MLTAFNGYYDGVNIVISDSVSLQKGQKVIITAEIAEKPAKRTGDLDRDLASFMGRGGKSFTGDAVNYVRELRENDRI